MPFLLTFIDVRTVKFQARQQAVPIDRLNLCPLIDHQNSYLEDILPLTRLSICGRIKSRRYIDIEATTSSDYFSGLGHSLLISNWIVRRRVQSNTKDGGAYFELGGGGADKRAPETITCRGVWKHLLSLFMCFLLRLLCNRINYSNCSCAITPRIVLHSAQILLLML